ncbi:fibronectin type III domain-containing protein [Candidatus Solirubrobacter pratensis]|uniref:fibronectin type III domain-containing protein n=1 Tax=Candidatus Solirubrobacter pratensis TaxID=1298857 RepID=UPI000414093D|nr:fibronectin type III domain-containing protein [Candidatus Solirubrobacter pratensis]
MRYWRVAAATAVLMLAGAGSAHATTRYVSPDGGDTDCTHDEPCALGVAPHRVVDGDVVQVAGGTYTTGEVAFDQRVAVEGIRGARPLINAALKLLAPGSSLRDVTIRGHGDVALTVVGSSVERVDATHDEGTDTVCEFDGDTTVSDTSCTAAGATAIALDEWTSPLDAADGHIVLRNVTAISAGPAVSAYTWGRTTVATISGSILAGDVEGRDAVLSADHSATSLLGLGNVSAATVVLLGNRPAAGSPTIDAGTGGTEYDLAGNARSLGLGPDMGAYEWVPAAPAVLTGEATAISSGGAAIGGSVDARGDAASFRVDLGTAGYTTSVDGGAAGAGTLPRDVQLMLTGLTPATTYHYRVAAANGYGTGAGEDRTFTTAALPAAPAPMPAAKPKVSVALPSSKRCKASRSTSVRVRIAKGGTITAVEVYVNRRRKLKVTKAKALAKAIEVTRLPSGRYTLEVRVKTKDGRTVKSSGKYRTCSSSR